MWETQTLRRWWWVCVLVLSCMRKHTEEAKGSKLISSISPSSLFHCLPSGSCLQLLLWSPSTMDHSVEWNKAFPLELLLAMVFTTAIENKPEQISIQCLCLMFYSLLCSLWKYFCWIKIILKVNKTALWIKELVPKPGELSLIRGTSIVQGEK